MGSPSPPGMPGTFKGREGGAAGEEERGPVQASAGRAPELASGRTRADVAAGLVLALGSGPSAEALGETGSGLELGSGLIHFLLANFLLPRLAACCSAEIVGGSGVSSVGVTVPESAVRGSSC